MCGILGLWSREDVAQRLLYGMATLQHRGQDAAGAVTFDGMFHIKKGHGLIDQVFGEKHLARLRGCSGLGHIRYATRGSTDPVDAQPVYVNYPYGLAMVHNGNVTNFHAVREALYRDHHRLVDTSNDVALLLYAFAAHLEQRDLANLSIDDLFDCVRETQEYVHGAYAVIAIVANHGMLAFTDPHGIRPLSFGIREKDGDVAFASESSTFDYLGYTHCGDLGPGEAVLIDNDMTIHRYQGVQKKPAFCVFEYIYFAREDSILHDRLVADERVRMGHALADSVRQAGIKPDTVIDVPASGYFFASALAEALGVPYRRGLAKNSYIGRSFIASTQDRREHLVKQKLNPIRNVVRGKHVAVVDDSIVRGTTSRHLVTLLRNAGAREVSMLSAAPAIRFPCIYGIDMSTHEELIAADRSTEAIREALGADAVVYQPLESLMNLYSDLPCCYACFNGDYPTGSCSDALRDIAREKKDSNRN
ncbi:MAG: amidophosphoribosyltransferase [Candidatus Atribacteria bacterium]|nr:MAG: amidophosphoribosyltransferase [Candidatus Atribacteria bacterium]